MIWAKSNPRIGVALSLVVGLAVALLALLVLAEPAQTHHRSRGVDLDVDKSVHPRIVTVGHRQTFAIKVRNDGNRRARKVVMRDPLPGVVRFVRASTSRHRAGSCGLRSHRTVVCHLGALRPDRTVKVRIVVRTVRVGSYINRVFVTHRGSGRFHAHSEDGNLQVQDAVQGEVRAP